MKINTIEIKVDNYEALAVAYKPLIIRSAMQVRYHYANDERLEMEDLMQAGYFGLYKAINTYNPNLNIYFGVYAKHCIYNQQSCEARDFLPHYYTKDNEKSTRDNPRFKRVSINFLDYDDVLKKQT